MIYAARDKDGRLFLYFGKAPEKSIDMWYSMGDFCEACDDIPSVQWKDDKPTKVRWDDELKVFKPIKK